MIATIVLAYAIAPKTVEISAEQKQRVVSNAQVQKIIESRCSSCHAEVPTDDVFTSPQGGVIFSDIASIKQWAPRIQARVIDSKDMPFMNKTKITDEERLTLSLWLNQIK
ncbi:MAG: putative membrane protein [Colwellia sp.]